MACGLATKIVLSAILLGQQHLIVDSAPSVGAGKYCRSRAPLNPNATIILKNGAGKIVLEQNIRVAQFDFYDGKHQRGGVPSKHTTFLFTYPMTPKTAKAETVEVKMMGRAFDESAPLQKNEKTMRLR